MKTRTPTIILYLIAAALRTGLTPRADGGEQDNG